MFLREIHNIFRRYFRKMLALRTIRSYIRIRQVSVFPAELPKLATFFDCTTPAQHRKR